MDDSPSPAEARTRKAAHPILLLALYFAFGASGGFLTGAAQNFYTAHGISTAAFAAVVSIALAPQVAKVLWAPLVDTTLTPKRWYLIALATVVTAIIAASTLPVAKTSLPALTVLALVVAVGASIVGMAADSLMAHNTAPERRGAAGGWSQAGNLGGAATGVSLSLFVANATHALLPAGLALAGLCGLCASALLFAPPSHSLPSQRSYWGSLKLVARDCWEVCRRRIGWLTLFVFLMPLGSSGAANLASGIARDWHADTNLLAATTLFSALATGLAAIVGGQICDRMNRRTAYVLFGLTAGLTAAIAALAPLTPVWFVAFDIGYSAATGLAYAAYAAATLEAIERGAAATKFTLFASVANIPVTLMPWLDGLAHDHFGIRGLLWTEFAVAAVGAALYTLLALASRPRSLAAQPALAS